ncbi:MAG TPA: lytic transglycosylase domain-containing protein [Chthoniobacteraceae bacterium]|nr:lytic transglycosylase domain-containing protein [Chthoniobacteraceae bacterium]
MTGFLKRLIFVIALAAFAAASLLLWRSPDPLYTLDSWRAAGRFSDYDPLITDIAHKHGVDPMLLKAVIWRESAFHPDMVGTHGERGLMQVGEGAAHDWAAAEKIETFVPTDLFDAKTNLEVGAWYLKQALTHWKARADPVPFALAEYNAGRTRVERWIAATELGDAATADDLIAAIEFPSTRRYVQEIVRRYRYYQGRGQL